MCTKPTITERIRKIKEDALRSGDILAYNMADEIWPEPGELEHAFSACPQDIAEEHER